MRQNSNKGAALITVLVAMMIISLLLFEFQHSTMVERQLAYNELNRLKAYYLAKSGTNLGLLRVALYGRVTAQPSIQNSAIDLGTALEMIWSLPLPPFPPDAETLKQYESTDKTAYEKTLTQTKVDDGRVSHIITSENSKINLNDLIFPTELSAEQVDFRNATNAKIATPSSPMFFYTGRFLFNLIDKIFKDSKDAYQEYGTMQPEEIVFDIVDWVSKGDARILGGEKDAYYQKLNPPYNAKRAPFFTLDELKMVKSVNDNLYEKLKPYLTVHSEEGKIHLNEAREDVYLSLYPLFSEDDLRRLMEERSTRGGWESVESFITYVTDELNHSNFKTYYPDENNYPFTISSKSFSVEALGVIPRSSSEVQQKLSLGVVMTRNHKLKIISGVNQQQCQSNPAQFYWNVNNACYPKPKTSQECRSLLGEWVNMGNKYCCKLGGMSEPQCPPTSTSTQEQKLPPNALKILYWMES